MELLPQLQKGFKGGKRLSCRIQSLKCQISRVLSKIMLSLDQRSASVIINIAILILQMILPLYYRKKHPSKKLEKISQRDNPLNLYSIKLQTVEFIIEFYPKYSDFLINSTQNSNSFTK